ncbi:hypothetical protein FH972_024043 [Carpinus fangiana]|uniref:Uncharacterized protein n=1 Tax=Carpinus fangiana TaxID=176857 RepID=A0A5N6KWX0_9ROSI|nr:hypothetical protein FH972_024043 [Carpinus fangiana]
MRESKEKLSPRQPRWNVKPAIPGSFRQRYHVVGRRRGEGGGQTTEAGILAGVHWKPQNWGGLVFARPVCMVKLAVWKRRIACPF